MSYLRSQERCKIFNFNYVIYLFNLKILIKRNDSLKVIQNLGISYFQITIYFILHFVNNNLVFDINYYSNYNIALNMKNKTIIG